MNSSANGLTVRPLMVMMPAPSRVGGNLSGTTLSATFTTIAFDDSGLRWLENKPALLALNCATELGSMPRNLALATNVTVSCADNVTMLGCGGCTPHARKTSAMAE